MWCAATRRPGGCSASRLPATTCWYRWRSPASPPGVPGARGPADPLPRRKLGYSSLSLYERGAATAEKSIGSVPVDGLVEDIAPGTNGLLASPHACLLVVPMILGVLFSSLSCP